MTTSDSIGSETYRGTFKLPLQRPHSPSRMCSLALTPQPSGDSGVHPRVHRGGGGAPVPAAADGVWAAPGLIQSEAMLTPLPGSSCAGGTPGAKSQGVKSQGT